MLECRACVSRCIRAIAGDEYVAASVVRRPLLLTPHKPASTPRRRLATAAPARDTGRELAVQKDRSDAVRNVKSLQKEIDWLGDRTKFADHVHYTLRCNKPDKALDLCRLASKQQNCVVAWNHVVDWHVKHSKFNEAIKIYNEMKKRGQFPDSYTYMMLFRSFPPTGGHHGQEMKEQMLSKALSIYYSMTSPNSRVKPGIMHTNAVLRLCSMARDMDALWSVASKIPETGAGCADLITYSILIGAIRHGVMGGDAAVLPPGLVAEKKQQAVDEGRRIWQEAVAKWRSGDILIDEDLVVEMANLLLISSRIEDWDNVLSLVQQTTGIDRLIAPVGSRDRKTEHVPSEDAHKLPPPAAEDADGWVRAPASNVFKPLSVPGPTESKRGSLLAYVKPGNGILSVLITACSKMLVPKAAYAYWVGLTEQHGLHPDLNNFHSILRLLKYNRSSARVVKLVQAMHSGAYDIEPRNMTYRLAMACCQRDWKNVSIMQHATALIDDMQQHLPYPDVVVLEEYLSLALQTESGPQVVAALNRMDPMVHLLRSRITYGADDERLSPGAHVQQKVNAIKFLRAMVGVIDTLMNRNLVPREDFTHWHKRRSQLNSFLSRAAPSVRNQRLEHHAKHANDMQLGLVRKVPGERPEEREPEEKGLKKTLQTFRKVRTEESRREQKLLEQEQTMNEAYSEPWQFPGKKAFRPRERRGMAGDGKDMDGPVDAWSGFADSPADLPEARMRTRV